MHSANRFLYSSLRVLITLSILAAFFPVDVEAAISTGKQNPSSAVLVGFKDSEQPQVSMSRWLNANASQYAGYQAVFPYKQLVGNSSARRLGNIYRLQLAKGADMEATLQYLRKDPAVEFAEPDYQATLTVTPDDPLYSQQWGMTNINAPAAWDQSTGEASTVIAVIDSGLDVSHEDLTGRLWVNPDDPANGVDDDGNGLVDDVNGWNYAAGNNDLSDESGHGTQVAGIAAATGNNGKGIAGMCWSCSLMVIKVTGSSGVVNYSDVAAGVAYAASKGADIINLSLGGYADSQTLRAAIESASMTSVIVAGAGNDNRSAPFYPSAYPQVIAVASTDQADAKASFSNYGDWVDAAAPGVAIQTTFSGSNAYGAENGTSLSAPFVSGLAGLLRSAHPDWSPALIRQQILNTAVPVSGQLGSGLINAGAAMATDPQPKMHVSVYAVDNQENGHPAPGQSFDLAITLQNDWLPARSLVATLSENDPYASLVKGSASFGDINVSQARSNAADPFKVSLSSNTPYNQPISFSLSLAGQDGYAFTLPFILTVRSAVEEIPAGSEFAENTTWTSDKTYILKGNASVASGFTLTIQPGTTIMADPDAWLRIEGGLVADGTPQQPIIFKRNGSANWAGLRFTDSTTPAVYNPDGTYLSGSILRNVQISGAATGAQILSHGVYVADSTFTANMAALNTGSSNSKVFNNTFEGNNSVAISASGGSPKISGNTIHKNKGEAISGSADDFVIENNLISENFNGINISAPSATIISNTIVGNQSPLTFNGGSVKLVFQGNRITANRGPVQLAGLSSLDMQRNLIAENFVSSMIASDPAVKLDFQMGSTAQSNPVLAYNPDLNEYLLSWLEPTYGQVKVQRMQGDGQTMGSSITIGSGYSTAVAYNSIAHEYLVAWTSGSSGYAANSKLLIRRISASGELLGAEQTIFGGYAADARLIYQSGSNTYLLMWLSLQTAIPFQYGQMISADGTPLATAFRVGADLSGGQDMAGGAYDPIRRRSLVTLHDQGSAQTVYGSWVADTQSGDVNSFIIQRDNTYLHAYYNPQAAYSPVVSGYLTTWYTAFNYAITVDAQILKNDGVYTNTQVTTGGNSAWPVVAAASSGNFLIAYLNTTGDVQNGYKNLYGRLVGPDGKLIGSPFLLSAPSMNAGSQGIDIWMYKPAIAYNSQQNEYMLIWTDNRNGNPAIFGQRVSVTGQLLDNAWTPKDETNPVNNFRIGNGLRVTNNTIINNQTPGVSVFGSAAGQADISNNNWFGNMNYDIIMGAQKGVTVTLGANYWGTIPTSQIAVRIYDCSDTQYGCNSSQSTIGKVVRIGALTSPDPVAPAFAQITTVTPDPLGIQTGQFEITFSRPMDTSTLPVISFHDPRRGSIGSFSDIKSNITSVGVDALGNPLVGTINGLYRFDGLAWQNYTTANSPLAYDQITFVFGATNGDIWIAYSSNNNDYFASRLRGNTWTSYKASEMGQQFLNSDPVNAIGEDLTGRIWFASTRGLIGFDGSTWVLRDVNGQLSTLNKLAIDWLGRVWANGMEANINIYDNSTVIIYKPGSGLPANYNLGPMVSDAEGNVWVTFNQTPFGSDPNPYVIARYAPEGVTYFRSDSGLPRSPSQLAVGPDGSIWANADGLYKFDGKSWSFTGYALIATSWQMDQQGNLWFGNFNNSSDGLKVLWGGRDHQVMDNAHWISPTQYSATFDVIGDIPQGVYGVYVQSAIGQDGIEAANATNKTFTLATGSTVSDSTPPTCTSISGIMDADSGKLSASWVCSDQQGINTYRYAVGTRPGGQDVVAWTYTGPGTTSVTLNGLMFTAGQVYYVSVQAQNKSGLWSTTIFQVLVNYGANLVYLPMITTK